MKVIEINEGAKIAYEVSGTRVTFGDDDLTINVAKYQRSYGTLYTGLSDYYVAQLDVPAFVYPEPVEPEEGVDPEPVEPLPLNMDDVTLTLWALI